MTFQRSKNFLERRITVRAIRRLPAGAQPFTKASRSGLMTSAWVVSMP